MNAKRSTLRSHIAKRPVDETDRKIIAVLRADPQATNKEIARCVEISEMTVSNRIDALIYDRLMKITVQRDVRTLGLNFVAHVEIAVDGAKVDRVARRLARIEQVFAVTVVIGTPQLVMLVFGRDAKDLHRFVHDELSRIDGVRQASVALALRVTKVNPGVAVL